MKALIKVGYGCNEHCTFCHTQDVRHIDAPDTEVDTKIRRAAALGHSMVVLSGGEATIRPRLVKWAELSASLGMDFGLVTNGLMLAYPELVESLVAQRLRYVYMSLHAGDARVHNSLVRRESFEVARRAIDNLRGRGLDLTINCVVTRQNVEHLRSLVDELAGCDDLVLKFSMVEPKGGADHLFDRLVPEVSTVAARVSDVFAYAGEEPSPRLSHGGIPLCLVPELAERYDDLRTHEFWTMIEVGEPDFFPVDDANKIKPPAICGGCRLRGPCPGLFSVYRERRGDAELRPCAIEGDARSNSFDWVYESLVAEDYRPQDPCPLLPESGTPWERARHLYVRHESRIGRYRSRTRDFDDEEIAAVKFESGQVYLDASRKAAPDDFARDLVKLERSSLCEGCERRPSCPGMFEPRFEDVFDRDDARVREVLATLEGEVLDVGAGEGRYDDVLRPRAEGGQIRYRAVEPDPVASARRRKAWPSVLIEEVDAEAWRPDPGTALDHVLVLRSWNHLQRPEAFLRQIRSLLRPGGSLTVVDNVIFGLARTPVQTQRARRSSAGFEHRRNDDAEAAHRRIVAEGFELRERVDVGPQTSNQWLLRYRLATLDPDE